jgi:hypothetical protein
MLRRALPAPEIAMGVAKEILELLLTVLPPDLRFRVVAGVCVFLAVWALLFLVRYGARTIKIVRDAVRSTPPSPTVGP